MYAFIIDFSRSVAEVESDQRQRVSQKVKLCSEEYLSIIEGALDGAIERTYNKVVR